MKTYWSNYHVAEIFNYLDNSLISLRLYPVLLQRQNAVARILAIGSAVFKESCAAIGWKDYANVKWL